MNVNIMRKSLILIFVHVMTVAMAVGTVLAYLMVPMRSLGQDSWKIASALMARHIGGGNPRNFAWFSIWSLH